VIQGWRNILKNHLLEYPGPLELADVDSQKLGELVNHLVAKVNPRTKKKLSPATIKTILLVTKIVKKSARADAEKGKGILKPERRSRFVSAGNSRQVWLL
jgi:hypothetical protein